jgi:hypothetical protein
MCLKNTCLDENPPSCLLGSFGESPPRVVALMFVGVRAKQARAVLLKL